MSSSRTAEVLVDESTLTVRGQTTIPSSIRRALKLRPSDKIRFSLHADNTVIIARSEAEGEHDDPMIGAFLAFIDREARTDTRRIAPIPEDLLARAHELTHGIEVDLDTPLDSEDE